MIQLDVHKYCHECPEFDPTVEKIHANDVLYFAYVRCVHHAKCAQISKLLEKQLKKEKEEAAFISAMMTDQTRCMKENK